MAVSPESITASVPSRIALKTSDASARVGCGLVVIDSSICVAVMTTLPRAFASRMIRFCAEGTRSGDNSTPRSPRATITPSAASITPGEVVQRLRLLDLRDQRRLRAQPLQRRPRQPDIVRAADEGDGDIVHAERDAEGEVGEVLLRQRGRGDIDAGEIDPFVLAEQAAMDDRRHDIGLLDRP